MVIRIKKATDTVNKNSVAIKKVFQDKRYKNREHNIISELDHVNCVKLLDAYYTTGKSVKM